MTVEPPELDPRTEDEVVADVIDNLPDALTDRNPSSLVVKLVEALGTFYGKALFHLNQLPRALHLELLDIIGIEPLPASAASVEVEFTSVDDAGRDVDEGTVIKTGAGVDAQKFTTDVAVDAASGYVDEDGNAVGWSGDPATILVPATAVEAGEDGNVGANTLETLESPIAGIDSVTNPNQASGGEDEEVLAAMLERAPKVIRSNDVAITDEDFELHAEETPGVVRALSIGEPGVVHLKFLGTDLNENQDASLQAELKEKLEGLTLPGVTVEPDQPTIRLVQITDIEVVFEDGADTQEVTDAVELALSRYITAVPIYKNGAKIADGWEWGASLWANEVVSIVDQVDGIRRVGEIEYRYSDDYGATNWESEDTLVELKAGADGANDDEHGMLHWGDGYSGFVGVTLTAI
jgi:uncharacterized phage protein gp47/JayE